MILQTILPLMLLAANCHLAQYSSNQKLFVKKQHTRAEKKILKLFFSFYLKLEKFEQRPKICKKKKKKKKTTAMK
jgi:hypothetical protein